MTRSLADGRIHQSNRDLLLAEVDVRRPILQIASAPLLFGEGGAGSVDIERKGIGRLVGEHPHQIERGKHL